MARGVLYRIGVNTTRTNIATEPDLASYDRIIVSSSGGKDSQAMLDYVVARCRHLGITDRLEVVHSDLGRAEWAGTQEVAAAQAAHYGLFLQVVKRSQGDILDHVRNRGRWPSPSNRYCTSDHKRDQIAKVIRQTREGRVLDCVGLRAEESPARAKRATLTRNKRLTTKGRTVDTWLPILDWTEGQVWDRIRQAGTPHHWAYDIGMPRLSCVLCIFAPKAALVLAGKHNPELLDEYIRIEDETGHTFGNGWSLKEIRNAIHAGAVPTEAMDAAWNM